MTTRRKLFWAVTGTTVLVLCFSMVSGLVYISQDGLTSGNDSFFDIAIGLYAFAAVMIFMVATSSLAAGGIMAATLVLYVSTLIFTATTRLEKWIAWSSLPLLVISLPIIMIGLFSIIVDPADL